MIHLKLRTEYSFGMAYGPLEKVLKAAGGSAAGIADRNGTWGHAAWQKACKKSGIKPIFGVELGCVRNAKEREKLPTNWMTFIAKNQEGLAEIYQLTTTATKPEHFYFHPRIEYGMLHDISENVLILGGATPDFGLLPKLPHLFLELSPSSHPKVLQVAKDRGMLLVASADNFFPQPEDRGVYEVLVSQNRTSKTTAMHIVDEYEWLEQWPQYQEALWLGGELAKECNVTLPSATLPAVDTSKSLLEMCQEGAKALGINLQKEPYKARLARELALIKEKEFEAYFYIIADLISYAKQHMLVGPARGSSCGSLVCYLMGITSIDPIPYGLLFERFIDVNRKDLPDVDIDFQDDRREMVFAYLDQKYGSEHVARLGTISRLKAKSAITLASMALKIPKWEVTELKGAIVERSGGDARASFCILDTFQELDVGRKTLAKYPELSVAAKLEAHASHTGKHAAGVVITEQPISMYCSFDHYNNIAQVDKYDAEVLNLLKIDALGLRTLSVLQDCLDQVGWSRERLVRHPMNDQKAFDVLNKSQWAGIFQFEGPALQTLTRQMHIDDFEDIASLTALARPGPLVSGGAAEYIKRRSKRQETRHLHPLIEDLTKVTYGVVIYQEQVMEIARRMGKLSWEDVSSLRKAMSKSLGKEFFDGYKAKFLEGALAQGVKKEDAVRVWENINTMGSWSFNRSHAIAYGMVSYWTLVLKAHFPLEFAAACLRNASDDDQTLKILRELHTGGYAYRVFDPNMSQVNWSVQEEEGCKVLVGGFTNLRGIGAKKAEDMIRRRNEGKPYAPGQQKAIDAGDTPFNHIFEAREKWGDIYRNPMKYKLQTPITDITSLPDDEPMEVLILAKLKIKNPRDLNELQLVQKRGGRQIKGQTKYLNMVLADDTGNVRATIDRYDFEKMGEPILQDWREGEWALWKGIFDPNFQSLKVKRIRRLGFGENVN